MTTRPYSQISLSYAPSSCTTKLKFLTLPTSPKNLDRSSLSIFSPANKKKTCRAPACGFEKVRLVRLNNVNPTVDSVANPAVVDISPDVQQGAFAEFSGPPRYRAALGEFFGKYRCNERPWRRLSNVLFDDLFADPTVSINT